MRCLNSLKTNLWPSRLLCVHEIPAIRALMQKYANVPMSFADACLVRMAELYDDSAILTLDSDFLIYRKYGRQSLETIMPVE
ncbi:hypothetical protein U14_01029 [Candidatus Moduliflexus flocculans]|uniref:PIN domain-containing protein n=1 Tax=Candidatus Moduliflexus flocculans TaxID=1499966 RepID=A0A0S6VR66_9BACT|nr:hypothetical protein U14_01029 [Candidatus Moduliflexus flocculans]